jgi:hypothetical protein
MKTKLEILDEVVNHYTSDPKQRALLSSFQCEYVMADGRMCAVGMCLIDPNTMPRVAINDECLLTNNLGSTEFSPKTMERFKEEYRINDVKFWGMLQKFHDCKQFWTADQLTEEGLAYIQQIEEYCN